MLQHYQSFYYSSSESKMYHLSWMQAPHVTLLYTMRAPPWREGTRTDDVMACDGVKLTEGMCSISRVNESN